MPSFGTTGALFARHFDILRQLKRRISLLKQSYNSQLDEEKAWDQVDLIIKTLDKGQLYLNFEEISSARSTVNSKGGSKKGEEGKEGEGQDKKQFYEDPTLAEDERKLVEKEEERRRI